MRSIGAGIPSASLWRRADGDVRTGPSRQWALAGAGTGKTTPLCARLAWLVAEGAASERILLLTFTRRAARELLQRARGLVPASARVLGGTFHSVAHRLLRRHAAALGLPSGFGVLDAG